MERMQPIEGAAVRAPLVSAASLVSMRQPTNIHPPTMIRSMSTWAGL